jgi:hypothetical protein
MLLESAATTSYVGLQNQKITLWMGKVVKILYILRIGNNLTEFY